MFCFIKLNLFFNCSSERLSYQTISVFKNKTHISFTFNKQSISFIGCQGEINASNNKILHFYSFKKFSFFFLLVFFTNFIHFFRN